MWQGRSEHRQVDLRYPEPVSRENRYDLSKGIREYNRATGRLLEKPHDGFIIGVETLDAKYTLIFR